MTGLIEDRTIVTQTVLFKHLDMVQNCLIVKITHFWEIVHPGIPEFIMKNAMVKCGDTVLRSFKQSTKMDPEGKYLKLIQSEISTAAQVLDAYVDNTTKLVKDDNTVALKTFLADLSNKAKIVLKEEPLRHKEFAAFVDRVKQQAESALMDLKSNETALTWLNSCRAHVDSDALVRMRKKATESRRKH